MDYEKKYLKYKKKYLNLKNTQMGGGLTLHELEIQLNNKGIKDAKVCAEYINTTRASLLNQDNGMQSAIDDIKKLQDAGFSSIISCKAINLQGKIDDAIKLKGLGYDDKRSYIGGKFLQSSMITTKEEIDKWLDKLSTMPAAKKELEEL